jgi:hypothetical protein
MVPYLYDRRKYLREARGDLGLTPLPLAAGVGNEATVTALLDLNTIIEREIKAAAHPSNSLSSPDILK